MFKIVREIRFCYGHRLMDYQGKCAHPHGHNGRVEIELTADSLDKQGMIIDFDDMDKYIRAWIIDPMDHKMVLRKDDPLADSFQKMNEPCYLMEGNPTAENLAREIFLAIQKNNMPVTRVTFWETDKSSAVYQPG